MGFTASKKDIASEKQPLKVVSLPPDVCLVPAPPPPTGPKGIPAPFPIMTDTSKISKKPASKVIHKNKKVMVVKSICKGIKGNEAGVGSLPPGTPKKDLISGVNRSKAKAMTGNTPVKFGRKAVCFVTSQGEGNVK